MRKVFVTDGLKEAITGQCLYFVKPRGDQLLSMRNISEVLCGQDQFFDSRPEVKKAVASSCCMIKNLQCVNCSNIAVHDIYRV